MASWLTIFLLVFTGFGFSDDIRVKVVRVIDGNTIEILGEDKEPIKIMLSEVDCPEPGQEHAELARKFTKDMVLRKKVTIQFKGKDRWGNKLGEVVLKNGKSLSHELVKAGLAWANKSAAHRLVNWEARARQSKTGLWVNDDPTPPWVYRRQQTMMAPKSR